MARFVVRRLLSMLLVLFAISVLTFLIFNVIPGGDPAVRLAGQATPARATGAHPRWGFNEPVYVQYVKTMGQIFTGDVVSCTWQRNGRRDPQRCAARSRWRSGGRSSIHGLRASGRAVHGDPGGKVRRPVPAVLAMIGVSMPVFWIGALMSYYLGFKAGTLSNGGMWSSSTATPTGSIT